MSKIVFFDIDGTICDDAMEVPQSAVTAIRKLRENGHLAFLCSGRARGNIRSKKIEDIGFDGIIAACGNHVEMDGKVIYERILEPDVVKKIIRLCRVHRMPIVLEGPVKHWLDANGFESDPYVDYLLADLGDAAVFLEEGPDAYADDIYINKFSADIMEYTNFEAIKEGLSDVFDFLIHEGNVLECVPKGTSKATGIEWLCNHLGIDKEDTYAIGDSINDLDMLEYVGHGIAMGNATPVAKSAAEYITTTLHDDGIFHALKYYHLI